jgi:hypothetical protein
MKKQSKQYLDKVRSLQRSIPPKKTFPELEAEIARLKAEKIQPGKKVKPPQSGFKKFNGDE